MNPITPRQHLLLVEDDIGLASLVRTYLFKAGFEVTVNNTGAGAIDDIVSGKYDLVILDITLPEMSGMEICKQARRNYHGPIIMFTALDDDMDQMLGLELGADDYIIKPVQPRLLLTRIKALLRRAENFGIATDKETGLDSNIIVGALTIDVDNRRVSLGGNDLELSCSEFDLLMILAKNVGSIVGRNDMVEQLRGFDYDGIDRSIDRRVSRLRKKLKFKDKGKCTDMIKTVRGRGYLLRSDTLNNE